VKVLDKNALALEKFFTGEPSEGPDKLIRVALSIKKDNGQKIRCLLTSPGDQWSGLLVIGAGFGRTIRHSNALAITAAHHGYASIRFDPTNHIGDSDGEIIDATASQAANDLLFICSQIRHMGWHLGLYVVAASLFARAAMMTIPRKIPVDGMILTLPVVDYSKTLSIITGQDLVAAFRANEIKLTDTINVLSHTLSGQFLKDLDMNCKDLESTLNDLRAANIPITFIAADSDEWVSVSDLITVLETERPNRKLYLIENTTHDSYSFGFIRAITKTTIQAVAEMNGDIVEKIYEVTFAKLSSVVKTEKNILNQARLIWRTEA